jgi:hypothetical protein
VVALGISAVASATSSSTNPNTSKEITNMTDKLNRRGQLTRDNSVLLLVDHQVGLYTGVRDIDTLELKITLWV